jgi:hypothetical protein
VTQPVVEGTPVDLIIDPGAGISMVSEEFLRSSRSVFKLSSYDGPLVSAANKDGLLRISGEVELRVVIGGHSFSHWFCVSSDLGPSVILGNDYLDTVRTKINYDTHLVELNGHSVPFIVKKHQGTTTQLFSSRVRLQQDVVVPPLHEALGAVKIDDDRIRFQRAPVLVEGHPRLVALNTKAAHQIVDSTQTVFFLRLANFSNAPVTLRRGMTVARCEVLSADATVVALTEEHHSKSTADSSPSFASGEDWVYDDFVSH